MAKLNVKVDNDLEDVKLVKTDKNKKKNEKKKEIKKETKDSFLSQVADELKLVSWPTKKNLLKYSIITILMILLLSLFFLGLSFLYNIIYGLKQGW